MAVALFEQVRSSQTSRQEANFRLRPAANYRQPKSNCKICL